MQVWDLRVGQRLRLTGGPYEGDVGTVMEKAHGHYRIRFADSLNTTFNVKRRPFSLWLGSWWLQQATHGLGLTPGGKIPLVSLPPLPSQQPEDTLHVPKERPHAVVPLAPPPVVA